MNLPVMQETWIQSLGWTDPLEEGMATHSNTPSWRTPQTEAPGRLQSMEGQRVGHDKQLSSSRTPGTYAINYTSIKK